MKEGVIERYGERRGCADSYLSGLEREEDKEGEIDR